KVTLYVCGPTVYDDIHIGNARPVIFFDILKQYLVSLGYEVTYVSNITDLDDKIIDKAKQLKTTEKAVSDTYTRRFLEMMTALGSHYPDLLPKATDYIDEMIAYIENLIELGFAYETEQGVYFRVRKIENYGQLSQQNLDALDEGVRVTLDPNKEDPRDFSIWKKTIDGLHYESPWGKGRPGWHTECAVINRTIFKEKIDIHGGGSDLKFPHHENEIAQTIAHDHHHLATYWLHVGRLDLNQEKMSKSLGNVVLVKDLIEKYEAAAFRLLIASHHYRQPLQYSEELMIQFQKEYDKIKRTLKKTFLMLNLSSVEQKQVDKHYIDAFEQQMNQDFNTPNVMTIINELLKAMNKETEPQALAVLYSTAKYILEILGIMPRFELEVDTLTLYRDWEQSRKDQNYERADSLRSELTKRGWL
ncbi:MAG: cysteine--tRNA ligase, partial [Acholeplasmataceae bacterium]|nr:cysteine--tRNA ligase [Acholeplasmataceae bacterium]